jgi:hypothetical protein
MSDNSQKTPFTHSLNVLAGRHSQDREQRVPKSLPCHVTKIEKEFVHIAFDVASSFTMPTVKVPQNFSKYIQEPTQVGDKGYVTTGDIHLGGNSGENGGTASMGERGNLTPLSFQPISSKDFPPRNYNQLNMVGGPGGSKMQTDDRTSAVFEMAGKVITHAIDSGKVTSLMNATSITHAVDSGAVTSLLNSGGLHVSGSPSTQITLTGVPLTGGGGGGGGIPEAPIDGNAYGRQNAAWVDVLMSSGDIVDGGNF